MMPRRRRYRVGEERRAPLEVVEVRPDELLIPPEEVLVIVQSADPERSGAALAAVADMPGLAAWGRRLAPGRPRTGQVYAVVAPVVGEAVANAARSALLAGSADGFWVLRASYAAALSRAPEAVGAAVANVATPWNALPGDVARRLEEAMRRALAAAGKGIWSGFWPVLLIGGGVLGLYAYARGRR